MIDISKINKVLDVKMDEYSTNSIKQNLERFEKILNEDIMVEARAA